jgi:hypothetical protein
MALAYSRTRAGFGRSTRAAAFAAWTLLLLGLRFAAFSRVPLWDMDRLLPKIAVGTKVYIY